MSIKQVVLAAALTAAPMGVHAATSLVDLGFPTTPNGGFGGFVVQSFTATEDNIAGIEILVGGGFSLTADISIGLYSDIDLTDQLAFGSDAVDTSDPVIGGGSANDIAEVTWDAVALSVGETYYLRFDTSNGQVGFYSFGRPGEDFYLGGQIVAAIQNDPFPNDYSDIASVLFYKDDTFGKDPIDPVNPVPLPAGAPLLLFGLAALAGARRRRG